MWLFRHVYRENATDIMAFYICLHVLDVINCMLSHVCLVGVIFAYYSIVSLLSLLFCLAFLASAF